MHQANQGTYQAACVNIGQKQAGQGGGQTGASQSSGEEIYYALQGVVANHLAGVPASWQVPYAQGGYENTLQTAATSQGAPGLSPVMGSGLPGMSVPGAQERLMVLQDWSVGQGGFHAGPRGGRST